jgi:hypothetical protein
MCLICGLLISLGVMGIIYAGRLSIVKHGVKHECLVLKAEDYSFLCPAGGQGEVETCHAIQYTVQFNESDGRTQTAKTNPPFESDLYKDPKYAIGSRHDCIIVASGNEYIVYWFMPSVSTLKKGLIGVGAAAGVLVLLFIVGMACWICHLNPRPPADVESAETASMRRLLLSK